VIISNNVLEHVPSPLQTLCALKKKIRAGGKIVFVVTHELKGKYKPGDINQHLYTWTRLNIGNLFHTAGFEIFEVRYLRHRWPPCYRLLWKITGRRIFNAISILYGLFIRYGNQIRIVAVKNDKV